jgi:cold shock protein
MTFGTVVRFDARLGSGSIRIDGGDTEVAVHSSQIDGGGRQSLRPGDRVAFTIRSDGQHPQATGVYVP